MTWTQKRLLPIQGRNISMLTHPSFLSSCETKPWVVRSICFGSFIFDIFVFLLSLFVYSSATDR